MGSSISSNHRQDDLQSMQRRIHEKKTSILDSTQRMLGLIKESEAVGVNTAAILLEQRENLENSEKSCHYIDVNLVNAQKLINKLSSLFGGIKNYFYPPKSSFPKPISRPQLTNVAKKKISTPQQTTAIAITIRPTNINSDTDTYFGKPRSAMDDLERETEDGLHNVHQGVNRLTLIALQMNEELQNQEPFMDPLGMKMDALNNTLTKKNKNMKTIVLRGSFRTFWSRKG
ncbi:unnamed protein product [Rotaria sp. Silwood2]|nr:unnamed protein product [Rotaria sp. Silwood2]CAF2525272.1 unnamed protein product [Rotaria sp. Silwood2]CAF2773199.1 unnamed protein product [Rotaria sp. Silwood2]CAF2948493.1 unnamed protein product [Rotaria sp. Silwood2]CAF4071394.1 unnamed protein product [Rotaria sp. Silwood2]